MIFAAKLQKKIVIVTHKMEKNHQFVYKVCFFIRMDMLMFYNCRKWFLTF